jgi:plasmid stabilization system protein ParE
MPLRINISRRAGNQFRKASEWWVANRPAAPEAIWADFEASVALLAEHPAIGAPYTGGRTPGVRRLFLTRVGYFIYYRADETELRVIAFWHAHRNRQPPV